MSGPEPEGASIAESRLGLEEYIYGKGNGGDTITSGLRRCLDQYADGMVERLLRQSLQVRMEVDEESRGRMAVDSGGCMLQRGPCLMLMTPQSPMLR
jgi:hypothetical protein